jgi:hypothetical protein
VASARREARRERWESLFPPGALALAVAAISFAFLFQRSLPVRAAMFAGLLAAALLAGKKVSPLATLLVSATIVAANLLAPVGRVLAVLGPIRITETALLDGIGKALAFEGLIYASKASVTRGLKLPGRFGALVASAFVYYDRIVEYKGTIRPATLVEDVDRLMLMLWGEGEGEAEAGPAPGSGARAGNGARRAAAAALIAAVAASYAALLATVL